MKEHQFEDYFQPAVERMMKAGWVEQAARTSESSAFVYTPLGVDRAATIKRLLQELGQGTTGYDLAVIADLIVTSNPFSPPGSDSSIS